MHTPNPFPVSVRSPVGGQNCTHQTSSQPMSVPCWPDEDSTAHTKPIPCQCQFPSGRTKLHTINPFPVSVSSPMGGQNCTHQTSSLSVSVPQWEDKIAHTKQVPCQCQFPSGRTKLLTPNKFPANVSSPVGGQNCTPNKFPANVSSLLAR